MDLLYRIKSSVESTVREKKEDFQYRRTLNTKFATAVSRACLPFPDKGWENTIIAEVKLSSPSKGRLAKDDETPSTIASEYIGGGAHAISVLTEPLHFEGDVGYLEEIRGLTGSTPLMMKDFVLDEIQIQEARAYGADGVLLISYLIEEDLRKLLDYSRAIGMWALVETHSKNDIELALECGADIIGVNNRDLDSFEVDLENSVRLCRNVPEYKTFVVESGISYPEDIRFLKESCERKPDAFLVGTALVKASDKKTKLRDLKNA